MSESATLWKGDHYLYLVLYIFASLLVGFLALLLGSQLAKLF